MKRLLPLLLVSTQAVAQRMSDLPVYVATTLYLDCVRVKFDTAKDITPTRVGINQFVTYADEYCLTWTAIWYGPLVGTPMDKIPGKTINEFDRNRREILQSLTDTIRKEALQ